MFGKNKKKILLQTLIWKKLKLLERILIRLVLLTIEIILKIVTYLLISNCRANCKVRIITPLFAGKP
jgi:hypothetical protein